ncbi:phage terminase large subunit [Methylobacterium oryzisoli]|uniref:phage terminase large subunit n=1 Tax=Methylobacterium oryzisoli TaxID=3385502 RepID=UPI003891A81C
MPVRSASSSAAPTHRCELTERQHEANAVLASPAKHILLRGGSRSGKTFLICRALLIRGLKAPGSTHAVLREHFNHLKHSVIYGTVPKVASLCFPGLRLHLDKTDWFHELPNGSRLVYGGLDDKERTEKILGQEHSSIFLNEASQISYGARNIAVTRLAQASGLALKEYVDCNPPTVGHWTFRLWFKHVEPTSGAALDHPERYASVQMNPADNMANLPADYLEQLAALPEKERRRFLAGEFLAQVDGALWTLDLIDRNRERAPRNEEERKALIARMQRIVVAVDPSGCSGPEDERSDEVGIVVAGKGNDGRGYVLDDRTARYSPDGWARAALAAYDDWEADRIVAERNFGGAMVASTIAAVRRTAPVTLVTASRGKTQRAEPVSALYEQDKVVHVGAFPDLEEQMSNFSSAGYQGSRSPDRADALVWALTDLMLTGRSYGMTSVLD